MLPDLIAQQDADVVVDQVPGGVVHFGQLVEKLLAGALRDDHDRMVLAVMRSTRFGSSASGPSPSSVNLRSGTRQ